MKDVFRPLIEQRPIFILLHKRHHDQKLKSLKFKRPINNSILLSDFKYNNQYLNKYKYESV